VGDEVNLWEAGDSKMIFIYRQGTDFGQGKIGICPEAVYKIISAAPGCDAKIISIYEGGCKISCRLLSKAEVAERVKQSKAKIKAAKKLKVQIDMEKLREEIQKKYSPTTSIKTTFAINMGCKLSIGDKVHLDIKDKAFYLRKLRPMRIGLLDQNKNKIGIDACSSDTLARVFKAYYNGYDLHLNVVVVYGLEPYTRADIEIMPIKKKDWGKNN
jgi:hypothetical protein